MRVLETWLLSAPPPPPPACHQQSHQPVSSLCPSATGQQDKLRLWWGGGNSVSTRSAGPTLSRYSPLFWEADTSETQRLLAGVGTWLAAGPGVELPAPAGAGGPAGNRGCSRPSGSLARAQRRDGEHPCPFPAHPLTKQPAKNQRDHPIKRTTGKEAVGHDERKRSSKTAEHWKVSEISLPSFFTQDIAVFSDVTN